MMKDSWARKQQEASDLGVPYQKYLCQEIHLKGKYALSLKINKGVGKGHQFFEGTWCSYFLLSFCLGFLGNRWIYSSLWLCSFMAQLDKEVNNNTIMKPDGFVLELSSINLYTYMTHCFHIWHRLHKRASLPNRYQSLRLQKLSLKKGLS